MSTPPADPSVNSADPSVNPADPSVNSADPSDTADSEQPEREIGPQEIAPAIEAVLLVVDTPTATIDIARAVGVPQDIASDVLHRLQREYDEQGRGFQLREAAGGWRLYTREQYAGPVERFVLDGQKTRLTQAALETLAVIAYRQPVTRARVSAIRGVNVDGVVRTLLLRELIEESGHEEGSGGGLLSTTPLFLEKIGLPSLADLPPIAPLLPDVDPQMDERLETGLAELTEMTEMD